jgi:hypothetical protein
MISQVVQSVTFGIHQSHVLTAVIKADSKSIGVTPDIFSGTVKYSNFLCLHSAIGRISIR